MKSKTALTITHRDFYAEHTYKVQMGEHTITVKGHGNDVDQHELTQVLDALKELDGEPLSKVNGEIRHMLKRATVNVSASKAFHVNPLGRKSWNERK